MKIRSTPLELLHANRQTVRLLETFLKLLFGNAPERDKIRKQKKEGK
jgi:hypothetical protein